MRDFLSYLLKWADGDGTDKTLTVKFRDAVGKAGLSSAKETKVAVAVSNKPRPKK